MLGEVKAMLSQKFKMKDLGVISRFLEIDFKSVPGKITMDQEHYLSKVLERFGMTNCKPKSLPSEQKLREGEVLFVLDTYWGIDKTALIMAMTY